jgi:hypothetical protein
MKGKKGIAPAVWYVLAAVGLIGVPTTMAEMQHSGVTETTPADFSYPIMRAGEGMMGIYS